MAIPFESMRTAVLYTIQVPAGLKTRLYDVPERTM
jgi:hypothetical protein